MKNVITKCATYKNYGLFNHIYLMIHTNDISHEVIHLIQEISKYKDIWLQSDELYYEEFGNMDEDAIKTIGFDKVKVMIDALGDEINVKKSLQEDNLVSFIYDKLPF